MITVVCSNCGRAMTVADHLAGKTEVCPQCGSFQAVPAADDEPPSVFGKSIPLPRPTAESSRPVSPAQLGLALKIAAGALAAFLLLLLLAWLFLR